MVPMLRKMFASALLIGSFFLPSFVHAADLSQDEAERVLWDTFTISGYTGLNGEADYAGKPENVISAALFGAYDSKMSYNYKQSSAEENGGVPVADGTPLFTVNGIAVMPESVVTREDYPAFFSGVQEKYTAFVSRQAAELAALRFTGHALKEHRAPSASEFLGETKLTDQGYFVGIDGLGDIPVDVVLKTTSRDGDSFILKGDLIDLNAEDDAVPATFKLTLFPGDAPGTWKRQYEESSGK